VPAISPAHIFWNGTNSSHRKPDLTMEQVRGMLRQHQPVIANVLKGRHFVLVVVSPAVPPPRRRRPRPRHESLSSSKGAILCPPFAQFLIVPPANGVGRTSMAADNCSLSAALLGLAVGGHGMQGWDSEDDETLYINDSGFMRQTYNFSDVVGWRLFQMLPASRSDP